MTARQHKARRDPIRKAGLPTQGSYPYVPPAWWTPSQPLPRGPRKGYIDAQGREWVKGPSRTKGEPFEWDVQLRARGHINVSMGGKITH